MCLQGIYGRLVTLLHTVHYWLIRVWVTQLSPRTGTCQMLIPSLKKVHQLMLTTSGLCVFPHCSWKELRRCCLKLHPKQTPGDTWTHDLSSHRQWVFWKNYSTESLLFPLPKIWKSTLDDGRKVGVLFIDFWKAFETVNHMILRERLKPAGMSGNLLSWLTYYTSLCQQFEFKISENGSEDKKNQAWSSPRSKY